LKIYSERSNLENLWKEECEKEEQRSIGMWKKKQEWLESYESNYGIHISNQRNNYQEVRNRRRRLPHRRQNNSNYVLQGRHFHENSHQVSREQRINNFQERHRKHQHFNRNNTFRNNNMQNFVNHRGTTYIGKNVQNHFLERGRKTKEGERYGRDNIK